MNKRICSVGGCSRPLHTKGLCQAHHKRLLAHGDVLPNIPIGVGKQAQWLFENYQPNHDECVPWPFSVTNAGYGQICIKRKMTIAYREACQMAHGEPPSPEHEAAHSCGNRVCVNSRHLRWATPVENAADRIVHGTHREGEDAGPAKLTNEQAATIRSDPRKQRDIAEAYGVTQKVVSLIKQGKTYKAALGMA